MDTPKRSNNNQIATSIGKFEDSPVFNFLNALSPIKPVKSLHITQTINPLTFASLPSVFTSPHISSVGESTTLRRNQLVDPSKAEFSSLDEGGTAGESSFDCSKLELEFAESFSCNSSLRTSYDCTSSEPRRLTCTTEEGVGLINQNKETTSCDWERLISNASDLLAFVSPNDDESREKSVDPATSFYRSIKHAIQNVQSLGEPNNLSTQPREGTEMVENATTHEIFASSSISNPSSTMDNEHLSGLCRGMRRRCLVFETGRKHVEDNSGADHSKMMLKSDENTSSNQPTVPKKTENDSRCLLPGIGLHLNALATTPKDIKMVNHEASSSRRLQNGPSLSADFRLPTSGRDLLSETLADYSLDSEIDTLRRSVLPMEEYEEVNPSSPKKRKRRLENGGEAEACKRCNCKKSKCLKLYCECFAAGVYCVEPCACIDCFNKPVHEDTVLATRKQIESRNPLAFAPKVIRGSDSLSEIKDDFANTPASARHKRGCNCKKSGCLKKYCECYQGGVGCSINCRCEGCKNVFGRKDGSDPELEEYETDTIETTVGQSKDSIPPPTPRQQVQPFSSMEIPSIPSFPPICSSSSGFSGLGKASFFPLQPKFRQAFENLEDKEMPGFLQGGSPINGINSSSPKRKRVLPPECLEMSSGLRSSRKLILRSIPSFPSLAPNQ